MPIIRVWCLPKKIGKRKLGRLRKSLIRAVLEVPELGLKNKVDIHCLFPSTRVGDERGWTLIEVIGLFEKPERTDAVKQHLARNLGTAVRLLCPKLQIECLVSTMDPNKGFWTSESP